MSKTIYKYDAEFGYGRGDDTYTAAHDTATSNFSTPQYGQAKTFFGYAFTVVRGPFAITSGLPDDAVISAAAFMFYLEAKYIDTNNFDLTIQSLVTDHPFSTAAFDKDNYSGNGGSLNTSGMSIGGWISVPLNEDGISWILRGNDLTKLGIRSSRDIAGIAPTDDEILSWNTYQGWPKLSITYTALPEVTSRYSRYVDDEGAHCYYSLVNSHDDGGCDKRGVCYNKTGDPTVADDKVETEGGPYEGPSNYIVHLEGLDPGTKYYWRGYAHSATGYGYGDVLEFTTLVAKPTVTTQAVSQKSYLCAMGNGTVVDDGGVEVTERGFEVKLVYSGTFGNYVFHSVAGFEGNVTLVGTAWEGTLAKTEKETGSFAEEAFNLVLGHESILGNPDSRFNDRLFECESYTYRAYATNNIGTGYGDYVAFTTDCYPVGHQDDNTPPIYIPPIVPSIDPPVFLPIDVPEIPDGYMSGMFYYRKAYTKKDLDELRRKCRIFLDNSVEYALVLNHNMKVLQQFLNMMHTYLAIDEFNGFRDLIPTQHLNALAREPLDVGDFKVIINNFISNSINNTMNVNNNFRLIRNGFEDYPYTEDAGFIEEKVATRPVRVSDPDVEMLKKKIDGLSRETAQNYATTQHNLYVVRAMIL